MKKIVDKILIFALTCMLAVTAIAPMRAEAATVPKSQTVYRSGKNLNNYINIYVDDLKSDSKITNVKSSKASVVKPYSVTHYANNCEFFDDEMENTGNYYANIKVRLMKKGTAKISFKVDGKTKSTTIKVLNYTNPVKTANITGTANGKSQTYTLANTTKNQSAVLLKNNTNVKNAKATFEAKSGWKITSIESYNYGLGEECIMSNYNGVKKLTVNLGTLKAKKTSGIFVTFKNTKTKGTIKCLYYFNYNN